MSNQGELFSTRDTLREGRAFIEEKMDEGVDCPCCGQFVKRYARKLNSNMAHFLIQLVKKHEAGVEWVPYSDLTFTGRDYNQISKWGLAVMAENEDTGKRTSGLWKATARGIAFVRGEIEVPSHAYIYNNRVDAMSGDPVGIRDALGKRFDYAELMRGEP